MNSKELFPPIFSRHANSYRARLEAIMARGEARGRQRMIDLVDARPGMRVLDLACGPGNISRRIAALVGPDGEVVGVDLAPGMIELARASGIRGARFEVMDIENLTFPDASFDAAACGHGMQFVPDVDRALREARRVLRPGGRFAASVPVTSDGQRPWTVVEEAVERWLPPAPKATDNQATRAVVGSIDTFREHALAAGFATAQVEAIEERIRWESAEQFVSMFMSWWDCASRLEGLDEERRRGFTEDAFRMLRAQFPAEFETTGRNHVLLAIA